MSARARPLVSDGAQPYLPRHVRLHFDGLRNAWALLSPEKVLWPDETSLAILKLCDGKATVSDIVRKLSDEYEADPKEVGGDVRAFLQDWSDRMVVRL